MRTLIPIGVAKEYTNTKIDIPTSATIVEITAIADCRAWKYKKNAVKEGTGIIIFAGVTRHFDFDFKEDRNSLIEIQGTASVSFINASKHG